MAGSMRTHTKGNFSSFILILLFSLTLFSCELFVPPQDQLEEPEQEETEEIPPHPIVGYWSRAGTINLIYHFTGSMGSNNVFYGNYTHQYSHATIEIHGDRILIWTGARYRMPPTSEHQISIEGDVMRWGSNPTIGTPFIRITSGLE